MPSGSVRKPLSAVGDSRVTEKYGIMTLVEIRSAVDATAEFTDGTKVKCTTADFRRCNVRNPNAPTTYGVGRIGVGPYSVRVGKLPTYEGMKWLAMLARVYGNDSQRSKTYKNCMVDTLWHNFQEFAAWVRNEPGYGLEGWHLDKDLLVKGNKIYSQKTCVLLPTELNLFPLLRQSDRGPYPLGVTRTRHGKFTAALSEGGKQRSLGNYSTPEEAFTVYKIEKEALAKRLAKKYLGSIRQEAYQALINFQVDISE